MTHQIRSLSNIALFLGVVSVNYLANALPINGVTQKELSAEYFIHITPAGYVFSIWGIIYLGLTAYVVLQALPKSRSSRAIRSLDWPFSLSCLFNMLWLIVWHHRLLAVSVVMMLGLLGSLMMAYVRLEDKHNEGAFPWFVPKTFGVYLGWVGLATILNISIWLDSLGWTGAPLAPQAWGGILLGIACLLYLYLGFSRRDLAIPSVLAWASLGIGIKNQAEPLIWISSLTVCGICLISLLVIVFFVRDSRKDSLENRFSAANN